VRINGSFALAHLTTTSCLPTTRKSVRPVNTRAVAGRSILRMAGFGAETHGDSHCSAQPSSILRHHLLISQPKIANNRPASSPTLKASSDRDFDMSQRGQYSPSQACVCKTVPQALQVGTMV
jgi:hypothetical protein